ncbi:MAG: membrane protein required for colicin V production [Lysobacterales bacterium]|jgi:membrane protein required for colicin V production
MEWPDYLIIAICLISTLVGALRGLIKEAFSLAVWFAAFLLAFQYTEILADSLEGTIALPSARSALAFIGIFVSVLVIGGLVNYLVGKLVENTGLSGNDRLLGGIFGAARGLVLVVAMILVAGLTPIPRDPWWAESKSIHALMPLTDWAATFLPESIMSHLDLHPVYEAPGIDAPGTEAPGTDV